MSHTRFAFALGLSLVALASRSRADESVVHLDASSDIVLQRVETTGRTTPVCRAPCDQALDTKPQYQLTGEGLRASNRFHLPDTNATTVGVKPRSSGGFVAGIVLMTISGVLATGGFFLLGATVALDNEGGFSGFGAAFTGLGAIVCGAGSLATGIPGILMLTDHIQSRASVDLPAPHVINILSATF